MSMNVQGGDHSIPGSGIPEVSPPEIQQKPASSLYQVQEGKLVRMDPVTKEMKTYTVKVGGNLANASQLEAMAKILNEHLSDVNIGEGQKLTLKLKPDRVTYYTKDQNGTLVGSKTRLTEAQHGKKYLKLADAMKVLTGKVETAASRTLPAQEKSAPAGKATAAQPEAAEEAVIDLEEPKPASEHAATTPAKDDIDDADFIKILNANKNEGPSKLERAALECLKDVGTNAETMSYTLTRLELYQTKCKTPDFTQDIEILKKLVASLDKIDDEIAKLISADGKINAKGLADHLKSEHFETMIGNLAVVVAAYDNINAKLTTSDPKTGKAPLDIIKGMPVAKRADGLNIVDTFIRSAQIVPRFELMLEQLKKQAGPEQKEDLAAAVETLKSHAANLLVKKSASELNTVDKLLDACLESASKKRIAFLRADQRVELVKGRLVLKPVGFMPGTRAAIKEEGAREILNILEAAKKNGVINDTYRSIFSKLENMPDFMKLMKNRDGTPTELGELFEKVKPLGANTMELLKGIDLEGTEPEELPEGGPEPEEAI